MRAVIVILSAYLAVAAGQQCYPFKLSWVLDVSGTITQSDFENSQTFVKAVVEEIGIQGNMIGAASYGDYADIDISCAQYTDIAGFNRGVDNIRRRPNQLTNTRDGIEKGEQIIRQCGNEYGDVPEVMILVTDGLANRGTGGVPGLIEKAQAIQNSGITLLVIAVGSFSLHQLEQMVPLQNIYVNDKGFDALVETKFIRDVRHIVCNIVTITDPPITTPRPTTRRPTTTPTTTRRPTTTPTTTRRPTTTPRTTTQRPTTTTPFPIGRPPVCTCKSSSLERYTCMKYGRRDIMDQFEGKCYVDKLRMAVAEIRRLMAELDAELSEALVCHISLRMQLQGYYGDASDVFGAYDQCVVRQYKLYRLRKMLMAKAEGLEHEIKMEMDGEGMLM